MVLPDLVLSCNVSNAVCARWNSDPSTVPTDGLVSVIPAPATPPVPTMFPVISDPVISDPVLLVALAPDCRVTSRNRCPSTLAVAVEATELVSLFRSEKE